MAYPPGQQFQAGSSAVPSSQVEISVSCRSLRDCDMLSKSDPMVVVFCKDSKKISFGRSEVIQDNLNPDFVKKFVMNYFFEESQKLKFEVYDVDAKTARLDAHDFIGRIEVSLGEIVGSPNGVMKRPLKGPVAKNGDIIIRAEEMSNCKEIITLQFKANKLDKKDFFGKSDPYLEFQRSNEDGSFTVVHRTEVIKNSLNPTWQPFTVPVKTLCNGDHARVIKVVCNDWNSDGSVDLIGEFTTTISEISRGPGSSNQYGLINPKKKEKKKNSTQMNFTVAIDFTASNGNPSNPSSLHYLNPYGSPNQYSAAIMAVGEIIQDYDSDKLFPALGFGARMSDNNVYHDFALNFNPNDPQCQGIKGVLDAYYHSLKNVQLYGPTNFSPVINRVAGFAAQQQDGSNYHVLLIITDGVITDMEQTKNAIVQASRLPMSIIIVGVGDADFEAMNILDGDDVRVSSNGQYADRDIVQFVPFRDFIRNGTSMVTSQAALAKEVLAEIPDQFLQYMKKKVLNQGLEQQHHLYHLEDFSDPLLLLLQPLQGNQPKPAVEKCDELIINLHETFSNLQKQVLPICNVPSVTSYNIQEPLYLLSIFHQ
ncbi:Nicotinic receptor-associated protein 1,Protein BONZAI 1,Protein BONZAI 2,Copine-5,Copine-8,Copine-1,Copine-2,Copine-A,Copine-4,Copine-9,Copine-7,Copine-6,Protein BONZAI 3,Copine-3 [Mytilus edulis]|uniref:Copine-3 n=1 Tax=Mytilus edulis TaxID=6550 RepID=A0A8S3URD9_MYTED|nr:Nicotinic receptor-associated protein 1,Protein BONZAI 1,Protein BONZAI 2,Copine-5,Copine-8,Copine-1,Copine-2,Copine-A,Copine-4,Copine-9,Copine-7,Copine-6,Protein BONZAI 3,Copine-3 [Mytilus edulis]